MNDQTTPPAAAQPAPARPIRRSLTRRDGLIPSSRKELNRAYNAEYRDQLRKQGIPTRRELSEAVMQSVFEDARITAPPPGAGEPADEVRENAKRILRQAASILRTVMKTNGTEAFTVDGIRKRMHATAMSLNGPQPKAET